jgi:hypothetical protein
MDTIHTAINPLVAHDKRQPQRCSRLFTLLLIASLLLVVLVVGTHYMPHRLDNLLTLVLPLFALHLLINVISIVVAAQLTAKDREPIRWAMLLLTNIDVRTFVVGKWMSSIRRRWHWYIVDMLLKTSVIILIGGYIYNSSIIRPNYLCNPDTPLTILYCYPFVENSEYHTVSRQIMFTPERIAPIVLFAALYSALDLGLTTICGVLGGTLRHWSIRGVSIASYLSLLSLAVVLFTSLIQHGFLTLQRLSAKPWYEYTTYGEFLTGQDIVTLFQMSGLSIFSIVDGGILVSARALRAHPFIAYDLIRAAVNLCFTTCLIGLTIGLYQFSAKDAAYRLGMAKPPSLPLHIRIRRVWDAHIHPTLTQRYRAFLHYTGLPLRAKLLYATGYMLLLLVCAIPRWVYMDRHTTGWLLFMIVVIGAILIGVMMRTFFIARDTIRSYQRYEWIDLLRLTPISTRQIIFSLFWRVFQKTVFIHLLMIPLKVGLGYAMAQYLNAEFLPLLPVYGNAFAFITHNVGEPYPYLYPALGHVLLAGMVFIPVGMAEAALSSAVGIFSGLRFHASTAQLLGGFGVWIAFLCLALSMFFFSIQQPIHYSGGISSKENHESRNAARLQEHFQVTTSILIDGGILASAKLMFFSPYYHFGSLYYYPRSLVNILNTLSSFALATTLTTLYAYALLRLAERNFALTE